MDYKPSKPGIRSTPMSSKDPPRTIAGGSKSGRVAATPLERLGKDYADSTGVALKRSCDQMKSTGTEPPKTSKEYIKSKSLVPIPHLKAKVSADRNPSTENVGRTQATGEKVRPKSKHDVERDSLKRTQDVKTQHKIKDAREKRTYNEGFQKIQVLGIEDTKMRNEKPREPLKPKTVERHSDGTRVLTGFESEKTVKKDSASGKVWSEGKTAVRPAQLEDTKKNKVSSNRKRPAESGKDVQMRTATKIAEPVRIHAAKAPKAVKLVTTSAIKKKQEKHMKKAFSLPGQRFETPEERDALRLFYESLHRQIPTSDMANIWNVVWQVDGTRATRSG
ncbi:uncharacterized protein [Physcomitrium patens]|uniref:Uncharacterized protein n=1 Tax=Physcomitrium patens TaxID=3218 RepID=A0A7I4EHD8_PHYPA|nr:uncharacterized protein LOC112285902 isoform X2 [Physcomitrium patens]|eukprot:XP_024383044.1 uncharacterized protein LOC112285902 isoform X2 [Physcomitrella patens]